MSEIPNCAMHNPQAGFFEVSFPGTRNKGTAISVYNLKPAFIGLLRPLASALAKAGVTANQVTTVACLLSVFYAVALAYRPDSPLLWGLMPMWLFISRNSSPGC
jgi:hypothetical protein